MVSAEIARQRNLRRWADSLLGDGRFIERSEVADVLAATWSDLRSVPPPWITLRRPRSNPFGIAQPRTLGSYQRMAHRISVTLDVHPSVDALDYHDAAAWVVPLGTLLHEIAHARCRTVELTRAREAGRADELVRNWRREGRRGSGLVRKTSHGEEFLCELITTMHLAAGVNSERAREVGLAFGLFAPEPAAGVA